MRWTDDLLEMRGDDEDHRLHHGVCRHGSVIGFLKLSFIAEKPPPSQVFEQVALMAAEENADYL
jgi:hypothetical protein